MLLTNDYVWGHNTSKATRGTAIEYGADVFDELLVPVGTRDFSSILLKTQQAKPDVVAGNEKNCKLESYADTPDYEQ